ncbi:MAG TPA: glycosyltransferase family 4 protein [Fimbriimonadaceae bacterium]|nr:glycosyltransferase family 4 protein [Fimbriimonadaceae bacterium]
MRPPLVLHVSAVEFTASRLLVPQMEHLRQCGYEVRIVCAPTSSGGFSPELRPFQPLGVRFPRTFNPVAMARAASHLRRLVLKHRPAIVHFHTPAASLPGRLALALGQGPRVVYTVHGFLHMWDKISARDRALNRIERELSRFTDVLLFQSQEDFERARSYGYHGSLLFLGNGVEDEWFEAFPGSKPIGSETRAIFVGRLTREKGVGELLAAARSLPGIRWTLVGDALPTDRDSLAADARDLARRTAGRVEVTGLLPPAMVRQRLRESDVFVLPSWREGVPRSVIEAMATGLPVVATDIRGCRELVVPGQTGWLVPSRDAAALTSTLALAAKLPRERLSAMGRAGRARASTRFRERDVLVRLVDAYRGLGVVP